MGVVEPFNKNKKKCADESKERFEAKLKKIAKAKPPKDK
jgi:hypothetical protein